MANNARQLLLGGLLMLELGSGASCVDRVILASSETSMATGFPDAQMSTTTVPMMSSVDSGPETTEPDSSSSGEVMSHDEVVQPIWDANCTMTGCHSRGAVSPDLSDGAAYAAIVGVMSLQVDMPLVTPSTPDDSYLWRKLEGTHTEVMLSGGGQNNSSMMPLIGMLSSNDIDTIMMWILDGAAQ
ncbi:MAG: hypothetical protein AAGF11_53435 [Myxococcota bacterium]